MSDNEKTLSLLMRCYKFFGLKPGQTRAEFAAEMRELPLSVRVDLFEEFNKAGMPTTLKSTEA